MSHISTPVVSQARRIIAQLQVRIEYLEHASDRYEQRFIAECATNAQLVAALEEAIAVIKRIKPDGNGNGTIVRGEDALAAARLHEAR